MVGPTGPPVRWSVASSTSATAPSRHVDLCLKSTWCLKFAQQLLPAIQKGYSKALINDYVVPDKESTPRSDWPGRGDDEFPACQRACLTCYNKLRAPPGYDKLISHLRRLINVLLVADYAMSCMAVDRIPSRPLAWDVAAPGRAQRAAEGP